MTVYCSPDHSRPIAALAAGLLRNETEKGATFGRRRSSIAELDGTRAQRRPFVRRVVVGITWHVGGMASNCVSR